MECMGTPETWTRARTSSQSRQKPLKANTPCGGMAALFGNHAVIPALVEEGHEEVGRGRRKKRGFLAVPEGLGSVLHTALTP